MPTLVPNREERLAAVLDQLAARQQTGQAVDWVAVRSEHERALAEHNVRIALATIQALGARGEVRAARLSVHGPPRGIVKALYYPDRRVQFVAAQAMLRSHPAKAKRVGAAILAQSKSTARTPR